MHKLRVLLKYCPSRHICYRVSDIIEDSFKRLTEYLLLSFILIV